MAVNFPESPYPGELVTDDASGRVWRWEEDQTRWVLIRQYYIPVPGPSGPVGPAGVPGPIGPAGEYVRGPQGEPGPAGFGINIIGEVAQKDDLLTASGFNPNDAYWVRDTQTLSIVSQQNEWIHDIDIRGPSGSNGTNGTDGEEGPEGPIGPEGFTICENVSFAPSRGPKGKLFIDNLNRIYVTTGL